MLNVEACISNLDWMRYSWRRREFRITCRQYRDMARGGNGGVLTGSHKKYRQFARESFFEHPLGIRWDDNVPEDVTTSVRQHYYPPNTPDAFFRKVCDGMGLM